VWWIAGRIERSQPESDAVPVPDVTPTIGWVPPSRRRAAALPDGVVAVGSSDGMINSMSNGASAS